MSPLGRHKSNTRSLSFAALRARNRDFSDEIQREDIRICESVQRGLHSRTYNTGRLSMKRENGVHHFHLLLADFLS